MKYKLKKDLEKGTEVGEEFAKQNPELVEEVGGRWKPEYGQKYWFIGHRGSVVWETWDDDDFDNWHYIQGNCFATEEECTRYKQKLEAIAEMRELAEGYEWRRGKANWCIYWDEVDEDFCNDSSTYAKHSGVVYFETEEKLEHARKVLGEEKLKLIYDIES